MVFNVALQCCCLFCDYRLYRYFSCYIGLLFFSVIFYVCAIFIWLDVLLNKCLWSSLPCLAFFLLLLMSILCVTIFS